MQVTTEHKVIINGIEFNQVPLNMDSFKINLERELKIESAEPIFRPVAKYDIEFDGEVYNYICNNRQTNLCSKLSIEIYEKCGIYSEWVLLFKGILKQRDIKINIGKCTFTAPLYDDSFSGRLKDFMDKEVPLNATKSLNRVNITPPTLRRLNIFDENGNYLNANNTIEGWNLYDAFRHIINYLSDGTINVVSNTFENGDLRNKYFITTLARFWNGTIPSTGAAGKTPVGFNQIGGIYSTDVKYKTPYITLKDIISEIRRKERIYLGIEFNNFGNPILRIDPEQDFYQNIVLSDLGDLPIEFVETMNDTQMVKTFKIGDNNVAEQNYPFTYTALRGFRKEQYTACGECDSNINLDLTSEWIIDSNRLHIELATNRGTPNDMSDGDKVVLIEIDPNNNTLAYKTKNYTFPDKYHYNERLTNMNILNRWSDILACFNDFISGDSCYKRCYNDGSAIYPNTTSYSLGASSNSLIYELSGISARDNSSEVCDDIALDNDYPEGAYSIDIRGSGAMFGSTANGGGIYIQFPFNGTADISFNLNAIINRQIFSPPAGLINAASVRITLEMQRYTAAQATSATVGFPINTRPTKTYIFTGPTVNVDDIATFTGLTVAAGDVIGVWLKVQWYDANNDLLNPAPYTGIAILDTTCFEVTNYTYQFPVSPDVVRVPRLPYKIEADLKCLNGEKFKQLVNNKKAKVLIGGNEMYIADITYGLNGEQSATLLSEKSLCQCSKLY